MTKSLIQLPEIIFTLIQTFLSYDDYHYFLNTSKLHFSHLKRRTIVFRLTERRSLQYMEDKEFQGLLLSKVEDGWKQIRLKGEVGKFTNAQNFSGLMKVYDTQVPHDGYYFDPVFEALRSSDRTIKVIPPISARLREMTFEFNSQLKDVSNASHLTKVTISYCREFEDISPLKNIPDLTFSNCHRLKDFSIFSRDKRQKMNSPLNNVPGEFSNVRRLVIESCPLLEDVSPLHGIDDLSIRSCKAVKDISGLGNHHRLEIWHCSYKLTGYEILIDIPHVSLWKCDISDLNVLRYVKTVLLKECDQIRDVSPIRRARRVALSYNNINVSELRDVNDLSLSNCSISDLLELANPTLAINLASMNSEEMIEALSFKNTHSLTVTGLSSLLINRLESGNISFFQHLQSLTINSISDIFEIKGLEDIPTVRLLDLESLTDISGLGRNCCVELWYCPLIEDVSSLANVSIVTIAGCERILDYSILSKVPRLKFLL